MNSKKLENISNLSPFDRYNYFIKHTADFEECWTIIDNDGHFALSDIDDYSFISLWPSEDFIQSNLTDGWLEAKPMKLTLTSLADVLFPLIKQESYLLNVFPINGKSGFVVSLHEFTRDLNKELEQYQ